jgi:hypothetical protein
VSFIADLFLDGGCLGELEEGGEAPGGDREDAEAHVRGQAWYTGRPGDILRMDTFILPEKRDAIHVRTDDQIKFDFVIIDCRQRMIMVE